MERARVLTFLRYAVTALSLTACALLVALWVRSYSWQDQLICPWHSSRTLRVWFTPTELKFLTHATPTKPEYWELRTTGDGERLVYQKGRIGWHFAYCPYWSPLSIAALLAVAPWIKWRFSIRTLLIATTLVAVALGVIVLSR